MSMRTKSLVPVFLVALGVAACGESPTSPTSPLPPVQSEPWSGDGGILWAQRSEPLMGRTAPSRGERSEADVVASQDPGRRARRDADRR